MLEIRSYLYLSLRRQVINILIVKRTMRAKDQEILFLRVQSTAHQTIHFVHTYHSRSIPEGVAEVSQILLRDNHVLSKLVSYEEHCRRDRW
jgi:hypothetical protein